MKTSERAYLALAGLMLLAALAIELGTGSFWPAIINPYVGAVALGLLVVVGAGLRVRKPWVAASTIGFAAALALLWYLPVSPVKSFARAVGRLHVGMSAAEVDEVMAEQVKGAHLAGSDGRSIIPEQPYQNKTYFEPRGQHHSFDTWCLVSWRDERVSDIEVVFD